jgi:ComF family protein
MGTEFGSRIPDELYGTVGAIVPVPLHKKREYRRGYNQSLMFANGISIVNPSIPVIPHALKRIKNTRTQTALNRDRRHANIAGAFALANGAEEFIKDKHILLVDDVVTTGVTTDEAAKALLAGGCKKVTVVSIARD